MRRLWTSLAWCAALAAVPSAHAADTFKDPQCSAAENSPLAEPDWYLSDCLGGQPPTVATRDLPVPWRLPFGTDLAFLHNVRGAGPFPSSLTTAPVGTLTYTLVGANARPIFASDFDAAAAVMWGIDNTSRELGTYNLTTGVFTATGTVIGIPAGETIEGLKFDTVSSTVYASTTTGTISNLYTFDLPTRTATLVGPIGFPLVIGIAISPTGQIYGHDISTDVLISINKTTGVGTLIGSTGANASFAQGMDFDNSTGILWSFFYIGGGANELRTFNLTTGASTLVVTGTTGPENTGAIRVPLTTPLGAAALAVDAAGNRVMEPGETAVVAPSWANPSTGAASPTGTLSNFTGPAGGTYTINDASAAYSIAGSSTGSCGSDCYGVTASATTRPSQHWDTAALETLSSGETKTWTLHVGASFDDVASTNVFYRFVETLLHKGVTGGCTATSYCPANATTRAQMSVFALVSKEGAGYNPPACAPPNLFIDVPETSPFCKFVEEFANRGITTGCAPGRFCPDDPVTREQMAIFVLRTLDPALNPPACGTPVFNDVPASSAFCRWIEELARRGVVTGCSTNPPLYCPQQSVTREQMSVFLSATFGLTLYGL